MKKPIRINENITLSKYSKDLKFRIGQKLGSGNQYNTLSNNITTIQGLLSGNTITANNSIGYIKRFSLLEISSGDRFKNASLVQDSIDKATNLEGILIALFHHKYNK